MDRANRVLAAVGGHLLLTVLHGLVHVAIPVIPPGLVAAVATVSLYILPVAGAALVVGGYQRGGCAVLLTAGIASLVFEGTFHFLLGNPDHVANHHTSFGLTAILTTLGNLLLLVAAWFALRNSRFGVSQRRIV